MQKSVFCSISRPASKFIYKIVIIIIIIIIIIISSFNIDTDRLQQRFL